LIGSTTIIYNGGRYAFSSHHSGTLVEFQQY